MDIFTIDWIRERVSRSDYFYSMHGDNERQNDNLKISEIEEAVFTGRILEHYEDTGRGDSCLVVGFSQSGKPIHVVCGKKDSVLVIITVYIPTKPKFITPFERG